MMKTISGFRFFRVGPSPAQVALRFAVLLAVLAVPALPGQTTGAPDGTSAAVPEAASSSQPGESAKPSNQPEGEAGDEIKLKHSSSVKFVARLTGMSLDHAYWFCVLLNFAMAVAAVLWVAKKNRPGLFRNRTAAIQKAMLEARKASEEANKRLADIEARLSRLDGEIAAMRASADQEAAAEELRIRAAAEEDARRIVESAEQEIAAATKAARRELTAYAADLAVTLATRQIHIDAPTDQALVHSFSIDLANTGGGSGKGRQ